MTTIPRTPGRTPTPTVRGVAALAGAVLLVALVAACSVRDRCRLDVRTDPRPPALGGGLGRGTPGVCRGVDRGLGCTHGGPNRRADGGPIRVGRTVGRRVGIGRSIRIACAVRVGRTGRFALAVLRPGSDER